MAPGSGRPRLGANGRNGYTSIINKEAFLKKFLIVSLTVLVLAAVVPQPAAAGFGLKGGLAQSNVDFSPPALIPMGNLNAPMGGIFWGFNLGLFTIQPEALYVRMGTRIAEGADWMENRLDYIQIPVLLKINLLPGPVKLHPVEMHFQR